MARPLRIFEGRFGRLVLADAAAAGEPRTFAEPLILLKVDGADATLSVAGEAQPLTREEILFVGPGQVVQGAGSAHGAQSRLIEFLPSLDWLRAVFPAVFEDAGDLFPRTREAVTPRIRQLADTLAIESTNDQFLSAERLEFMLQELMLSVVESYLARRRSAGSVTGAARGAGTWHRGSRCAGFCAPIPAGRTIAPGNAGSERGA